MALAFSPDGRILAVADHTAGLLVRLDPQTGKVIGKTELSGQPADVAWSPDGSTVYVTFYRARHVAELDSSGSLRRALPVGDWPVGAATAATRGWLLTADYASDAVSIVQCPAGRPIARLPVTRMPYFLAVSPDEKLAVVGNRLPADDASQPANGTAGPTSRYVTGQGSSAADDPTAVELVIGDRPAAYGMGLYLPGIVRRIDLPGKGPRGLALSPDGRRLALAMYFAGTVVWIDAQTLTVGKVTPLDSRLSLRERSAGKRGQSPFVRSTLAAKGADVAGGGSSRCEPGEPPALT